MSKIYFLITGKKLKYFLYLFAAVLLAIAAVLYLHFAFLPESAFLDPGSGIIAVDPGHGGIDGGTNRDGILEKDINLAIALKLQLILEQRGYKVVMTRNTDVSLDKLNNYSSSRHLRDLNARVDIINNCNAQLFLSIHVNCNLNRPLADGSIVLYGKKYDQNETLAYSIQRSLNEMVVNGRKRTVRDPRTGDFFILEYSKVPGVIIETAFISNAEERQLLLTEDFREQLALAIANGMEKYLSEQPIGYVK